MQAAQWVTLAVALVAAAASIVAAVSARRSADTIDRRRHEVAALDYERETFMAAYSDLVATFADIKGAGPAESAFALIYAAEPLAAHPRATTELVRSIDGIRESHTRILNSAYGTPKSADKSEEQARLIRNVVDDRASMRAETRRILD